MDPLFQIGYRMFGFFHRSIFQRRRFSRLLLPRICERCIRQFKVAPAQQSYGLHQAPRRIAHFFMKIFFLVEIIVAGRVRLVVPNVAPYQCALSRWYEANVGEPVGENSSQVLDSGRIAVDHDRKDARPAKCFG